MVRSASWDHTAPPTTPPHHTAQTNALYAIPTVLAALPVLMLGLAVASLVCSLRRHLRRRRPPLEPVGYHTLGPKLATTAREPQGVRDGSTKEAPGRVEAARSSVSGDGGGRRQQKEERRRSFQELYADNGPAGDDPGTVRFPVQYTGAFFHGREVCSLDDPLAPCLDVTYTNDPTKVTEWLEEVVLGDDSAAALGFDTETKPRFHKLQPGEREHTPAVLQLASHAGKCMVVQLWWHPDPKRLWRALAPVLGDPVLPKVGVSLDDDCVELWRASRGALEVRNRLDIGGVGVSKGSFRTRGLGSILTSLLGVQLAKPKKVQVSNWGRKPPLQMQQVVYAAADAWAGAAVFHELQTRRPDLFGSGPAMGVVVEGAEGEADGGAGGRVERTVEELSERRGVRAGYREQLIKIFNKTQVPVKNVLTARTPDDMAVEDVREIRRIRKILRGRMRTDGVVFYTPEDLGLTEDGNPNPAPAPVEGNPA